MIGVASRNANRAASLFESPASRPPPIVAPEREKPGDQRERLGGADADRVAPADLRAIRVSSSSVGLRRAAPQQLGAEEQHAVQRRGRTPPTSPRRTRLRSLCSSSEPEDARPGSSRRRAASRASRRCRPGRCRGRAASGRALDDPHPVAPEEPEQDERGREVRRDEEGDEVLVVLVDVPAEELRQDHAVAEARDREELGHALEQPEDDRPRVGDQRERGSRGGCRALRAADGTRRTRGTRARAGRRRSRA